MIAVLLFLSLNASDTLATMKVGDLTLKLPQSKDWKGQDADDASGKGKSVSSNDGDAQIELNVYEVDPRRDGKLCVEQLLKALGPDGYEAATVGGAPAYKKVTTDFVGQGENAKTDANKVNTVSYVGCNGQTKWILSMTSKASKAPRFGVLLKRVIESITYGAGASK
jgi:hypothetical protein